MSQLTAPGSPTGPVPVHGPVPGPRNAITDVPGLRVGHARLPGALALSGTTVVLAPPGGAVAAVDVRGSGPGTRETDALTPGNVVERVDAVVLTGGSAYGLAAADGVAAWLEEAGRGHRVGPDPAQVVPVVPTAALFDLGRGGDFRARPDAATGRAAVAAAAASPEGAPVEQGAVGAGTGAMTAGMRGGVGTASAVLPGGVTVAALVAVNALGSTVDPATGLPYGVGDGLRYADGTPEFPLRVPGPEAAERARRRLRELAAEREALSPLNTTLGVVATDARLDRAHTRKLAAVAHDGMARAVRPCHSLADGDTVFALATGTAGPPPARPGLLPEHAAADAVNALLAAVADVFARAVAHAVLHAEPATTPWGHLPSYRELHPEAFA
ncbi:P1 family peptidase [Streptacidiphilus sp. ASG 303]|uniref:P1 family peptidase n=1 Tax=Streptomycetaceae TaxID=2062 RepID=UPI001E54B041|nr:P1 family peptidase [Streptacidiphilus sp. ASG 303]MCD0481667.1 P1 family peptidase [Streptacidiphilus sp. ASG 303]